MNDETEKYWGDLVSKLKKNCSQSGSAQVKITKPLFITEFGRLFQRHFDEVKKLRTDFTGAIRLINFL